MVTRMIRTPTTSPMPNADDIPHNPIKNPNFLRNNHQKKFFFAAKSSSMSWRHKNGLNKTGTHPSFTGDCNWNCTVFLVAGQSNQRFLSVWKLNFNWTEQLHSYQQAELNFYSCWTIFINQLWKWWSKYIHPFIFRYKTEGQFYF